MENSHSVTLKEWDVCMLGYTWHYQQTLVVLAVWSLSWTADVHAWPLTAVTVCEWCTSHWTHRSITYVTSLHHWWSQKVPVSHCTTPHHDLFTWLSFCYVVDRKPFYGTNLYSLILVQTSWLMQMIPGPICLCMCMSSEWKCMYFLVTKTL